MARRSMAGRILEPDGLTRRELLVGGAAVAMGLALPVAASAHPARSDNGTCSTGPKYATRRLMAAAALLGDGRILVSGGYDRHEPMGTLHPLRSASIYDPGEGTWSAASPMSAPRARHAAVSLPDGTVAVLGGIGSGPTASMEVYDPATNRWRQGPALAMPRFDHSAVSDGRFLYVLGGTSLNMSAGVETIAIAAVLRALRA